MAGMYEHWEIKQSDVAFELNRDYTPEENEIVRAAEKRGYTGIRVGDDMIEGTDKDGHRCIIAEK